MALPKRRHSSTRQAKRRTHYKLTPNFSVSSCPRCGAARASYTICSSCGFYNGRQWYVPKAVKKEQEAEGE
jgi:large subunit ribosomal protein L32